MNYVQSTMSLQAASQVDATASTLCESSSTYPPFTLIHPTALMTFFVRFNRRYLHHPFNGPSSISGVTKMEIQQTVKHFFQYTLKILPLVLPGWKIGKNNIITKTPLFWQVKEQVEAEEGREQYENEVGNR